MGFVALRNTVTVYHALNHVLTLTLFFFNAPPYDPVWFWF